ncbi:membrane protein [Lactobacillus selangorensis]|uniref:Riboflavin transporter n=1 Tax=Lactobacillus selangorensis TaxID=81857 RepID=A0A0R2FZU0_9LACO|nr:ECF transporter S component [Lactobacillus selangorensis]KRN29437.1 membrane protein [Lactobacillus selangorensis]KRN34034.1 membrane protein [Lactobacillus selangorensis]
MQQTNTRRLIGIAMMAACSYVLLFLAFPILPLFSWLKVDFSDVVVLISTFLYGPWGGIITAFLRSLLYFITSGANLPAFIGDAAGFIASVVYVLPIYWLFKRRPNWQGRFTGYVLGTISLTVVMSLLNYWLITPLYMQVIGLKLGMPLAKYILFGVAPFNLVKGILVAVVFAILYVRLVPWMKRHQSVMTK